MKDMKHKLFAEAIGSFFLFATVVGSGIMAQQLSGGNVAVALLGNTIATGAMLFVLITMLGPISGAHFNPAVSLVFRLRGELGGAALLAYAAAQLIGGIAGVWAAHIMFDYYVRPAHPSIFAACAHRPRPMAWRIYRNLWLGVYDIGDNQGQTASRCRQRGSLYHRGLLVHLIDQLRQSRHHYRPVAIG